MNDWIPNPDYEKAEEIVFLFHESIFPQAASKDFGVAAHCRCCGALTNHRKDGEPRCSRCQDNLITFTDNL